MKLTGALRRQRPGRSDKGDPSSEAAVAEERKSDFNGKNRRADRIWLAVVAAGLHSPAEYVAPGRVSCRTPVQPQGPRSD